ncbi:MAG: EamA family transporter [Burkholderia sp.]|nr:EamA family transporter [Burkholderia sp.]
MTALTPSARQERLRGFGIFLFALLLLAILDVLAKHLVQRYPPPFINMVRYVVILSMSVVLLWRHGLPVTLDVPHRKLLLVRGVMMGTTGTCFSIALYLMPLAEATAIYFVSPLIVVMLSPWLLNERVTTRQWLAVIAGSGGMLLIVRLSTNLPVAGAMLMLLAAISYAILQILTRKVAGKVAMPQQFFCAAVVAVVMAVIPAPFYLPQQMPPPGDMALIVSLGFFSGGGQYLLIKAFQKVPASVLAPFNYFQLLLAVIFGVVFFHQHPDALALAGMCVIMGAGVSLTLPAFGGPPVAAVDTSRKQ